MIKTTLSTLFILLPFLVIYLTPLYGTVGSCGELMLLFLAWVTFSILCLRVADRIKPL